ncbi:MAG: aminoacetone oxidase family FAD-binding enzyme [Alkalispirochaeta sp.]
MAGQIDPTGETWDAVVVGGGPAGMIAAARSAERGCRTLLIEKNPVLGKKLLITGGGRCNVTTALTDRHDLTSRFGQEGKYLHSLFARFSPDDTRALLQRFGLATKVEAEHRVFPVTDSAASVRDVCAAYMAEAGVQLILDRSVTGVVVEDGRVTGVKTHRGEAIRAARTILAMGEVSRPETGSTGDWFSWLKELGIPVRDPEASLVPIRTLDRWVHELQGLALGDVALHVEMRPAVTSAVPSADRSRRGETEATVGDRSRWGNARRVCSRRGKLLFTHFGLSGPMVLNAASEIQRLAAAAPIRLRIDVLPGHDAGALHERIKAVAGGERTRAKGGTQVKSLLRELVPARLVEPICAAAGVRSDTRVAEISRKNRRNLVEMLKGLPCAYSGLMGQDKAVVSSGGVHPSAIDFRSMFLHTWPTLAVLGDMVDIDRRSGGFSLQMCWAGGWVAGDACTT